MAAIVCRKLKKTFDGVQALGGVSCALARGELLLVLGPSAAGKTSLLRVIAGLERPDSGTVCIWDRMVTGPKALVAPHQRDLGFVFQRPTLWPHLSVLANVSLALGGRGMKRAERRAAARAALAELGMTGREEAWPATLSGGELQRVALARAFVTRPRILLLDEPFASLDTVLRKELLATLIGLKEKHSVSMICVSHRFEEVFAAADRILLLRNGKVEEDGALQDILASPRSAFTREFLGV